MDLWVRAGLPRHSVREVIACSGTPPLQYALLAGAGGVYQSGDGGATWRLVSSNLPPERSRNIAVQALAVDMENPLVVYAGMGGAGSRDPAQSAGLYVTNDGGATWSSPAMVLSEARGTGSMAGQEVQAIAVASGVVGADLCVSPTCGTVCAATVGGIFCNTGEGQAWVRLDWRGVDVRVLSLAIHPGDASMLCVGTDGFGLYTTQDAGITWKQALEGRQIYDVVIPAAQPDWIHAATDQGVFKSMDGGATWMQLGGPTKSRRVNTIALHPQNEAIVYAGLQYGAVYCSVDGGGEWVPLKKGLGDLTVLSLMLDPENTSVLWAGTTDGIWRYEFVAPASPSAPLAERSAEPTPAITILVSPSASATLTVAPTPRATPPVPLPSPTASLTALPTATRSSPTVALASSPTATHTLEPLPTHTLTPTPTPTETATSVPPPTALPPPMTATPVPR